MTLRLIPAGSTIEETRFVVPDTYTIGTEYPTFLSAVRAAVLRRDEAAAKIREGYPSNWPNVDEIALKTANVSCVVDLRWMIRYPDGSATDTVVERSNVSHLTLDHIDRHEAMAREGSTVR